MTKISKRERLQILAIQIKTVEVRIAELEKALVIESDVGTKDLMRKSRKAAQEMLAVMKEKYWSEEEGQGL